MPAGAIRIALQQLYKNVLRFCRLFFRNIDPRQAVIRVFVLRFQRNRALQFCDGIVIVVFVKVSLRQSHVRRSKSRPLLHRLLQLYNRRVRIAGLEVHHPALTMLKICP